MEGKLAGNVENLNVCVVFCRISDIEEVEKEEIGISPRFRG